jgi:hypothetical protein
MYGGFDFMEISGPDDEPFMFLTPLNTGTG